ncbi:MAG: thioredoxin domain-containing protein [Alphaproteobacteria bacterium]|nr:thioredoxin domain-containing protein [Alphaproteobacteria bacterium]
MKIMRLCPKILTILSVLFLFGAGLQPLQANAQSFSAEQKKELEELFKEFLADNPESILKSVDDYRAEQERKSQQSAKDSLKEYKDHFKDNSLPMAGNPSGDVTVVEFFDYNCGYCRKAFEDLNNLINEDKNLRVVFQELPILSPSSKTMAEIALAANMQGKYFEMHRALMDYRGSQTADEYYKLAQNLGLDVEKLKTDSQSAEVQDHLKKTMDIASAVGIRGTPGFIIGDEIYPGYIGMDGLKSAIKKARDAN